MFEFGKRITIYTLWADNKGLKPVAAAPTVPSVVTSTVATWVTALTFNSTSFEIWPNSAAPKASRTPS